MNRKRVKKKLKNGKIIRRIEIYFKIMQKDTRLARSKIMTSEERTKPKIKMLHSHNLGR